MPSYKIHSLKDSNKLSFIIEGESENSVQQKLSGEGYIVLSVEKTEVDTGKIFVFEGRKPDKSFIEGKIEADNIFIAYEMLTKEYTYNIVKLYPNSVTDTAQQQKIFQELLSAFEEKKIQAPKNITDTAGKALQKNKTIIEKLENILKTEDIKNKEIIVGDLKKLEQSTNSSTIHQNLKEIIKDLIVNYRKRKDFFNKLKPLAAELGVFVAPNGFLSVLDKLQNFFVFLGPLLHPEESDSVMAHSHDKKHEKNTDGYIKIQKDPHIHTLMRRKYQKGSLFQLSDPVLRQSYSYTLYRGGKTLFISSRILTYF